MGRSKIPPARAKSSALREHIDIYRLVEQRKRKDSEKRISLDALLCDARKSEKDVLLQDCGEILRRIKKLSKR
jgi:hypothetical protein